MSKELAKKEENKALQLTAEDIRKYICPKADDKEIKMFLELCKHQNLNPFIGDAYLVKYGTDKAQQIVGRHLFNKRASEHPQYDGMKQYYMVKPTDQPISQMRISIESGEYDKKAHKLIGAITEVYRKDMTYPLVGVAYLDDFDKEHATWKTLKTEMILKVSEVLALRKAFPAEFQGMYIKEEMGIENEPKIEQIEEKKAIEAELDNTDEQSGDADTSFLDMADDIDVDIDTGEIDYYAETMDLVGKYVDNESFVESARKAINKLDKNVRIESFKDVVDFCAAYRATHNKYPLGFMNK